MMGLLGPVMITVRSEVGLNFNLNVRYVDTKLMIWKLWQVNPGKVFRTDELNQDLLSNKS